MVSIPYRQATNVLPEAVKALVHPVSIPYRQATN